MTVAGASGSRSGLFDAEVISTFISSARVRFSTLLSVTDSAAVTAEIPPALPAASPRIAHHILAFMSPSPKRTLKRFFSHEQRRYGLPRIDPWPHVRRTVEPDGRAEFNLATTDG